MHFTSRIAICGGEGNDWVTSGAIKAFERGCCGACEDEKVVCDAEAAVCRSGIQSVKVW